MKDMFSFYIILVLYIGLLVCIGFYSYRKTKRNLDGYMLGDRGLSPMMTALSVGASDMSGWLLMGLPGSVLVGGVAAIWIAIGLTIGAYLNYLWVAPRLRSYTEIAKNSITIPDFFENRFYDSTHNILRLFSGLVILIFFALYTAAGIVGGGVLFTTVFKSEYTTGLLITMGVVVIYTYFGGFLAVSMADLIQGTIMFIALIMVPLVVFFNVGATRTFSIIDTINPKFLHLFTGASFVSIISLLAWGLGYFGQPHIIVRFMAIKDMKKIGQARHIGISWMLITILGATFTGLLGIVYLSVYNIRLDNPETIFIYFSQVLFHPLIGGFLLSAILAAIMSTVASQLLVTSSSLTKDFYHLIRTKYTRIPVTDKELVNIGRLSVLLVAVIATWLAWNQNNTILNLVGNAWAGFGASFGPAVLLSLFWKRFTKFGALISMIGGAVVVIIWIIYKQFGTGLYEMIPGFIISMLFGIVCSYFDKKPTKVVEEDYKRMVYEMKKL